MLRFFGSLPRHLLGVLLVLLIASCSGGGCSSGCSGCGATPLPGGFKKANTITNAASVRVTRTGLDFLAQNIPSVASQVIKANNGVVTFDVPKSDQSTKILLITYNIHICPNGPNHNANPPECVVEVNVAGMKLHLDAITPHSVKISGTVPVRMRDLPVNADVIGDINVGLGTGSCNGGTPNFDYKDIPVDIELPLVMETIPPRDGYTKIDTKNAIVNVSVTQNDVAICKDCGFASAICDGIFGVIKNFAFNSLIGGVTNQIKNALDSAFCTKPIANANPPCPDGSQPDANNAKCVYTADTTTCVPTELGTDGHLNLAGALAKLSPGTSGALDFGLAAGGDMDPAPDKPADDTPYPGHTPNGITLGFLGGTLPQPQSSCVPKFDNPLPQGIPIPDEMVKDQQTPWPASDPNGPHVGIAIAGRFLNHSLATVYNSGALCLGVSTEQVAQLNSGLLSVLIPSFKKLTFEGSGAPVAIATRPQAPPTIVLGGGTDIKKDPLLLVTLPKFNIDFYVWSDDRFIRTFTLAADITVPVNLQTGVDPKTNPNGGLLPVLGSLGIANAKVTNADETLTDDPNAVAAALSAILQGFAGQFLGSGFKPIDLTSSLKSLGLTLTIPEGGIRKLTKDRDDFLAIFADLGTATKNAQMQSDTTARLLGKTVHAEAMGLTTARDDKMPTLHVALGSTLDDGARAVEYSWWLDQGTHSAWSRDRDVVIADKYLFYQGKHVLYVSSRVVGAPETEDVTPAEVPFAIDVLPPEVSLTRDGGDVRVSAWDIVSPKDALTARYRVADSSGKTGDFGPWTPLADLAKIAVAEDVALDVEVSDEEGNVGKVSQGLIRGRDDPTLAAAGSSCGCSTPGKSPRLELGASLAALAALLLLAWRRRGRSSRAVGAIGLGAICVVGATTEGCACGTSNDTTVTKTGCGSDCNQQCQPAVPMGLVGSYTSLAKAKDGTIWVAGYNEEYAPPTGNPNFYGDLVVGKYDKGKQLVAWTTVDGLPARTDGTCPDADPHGWRNGESDPGDDVGRWTTMQLDANDHPMVAYFDDTHEALKFASTADGVKWDIHTVAQKPQSDLGRYAKMILVAGKPVLAYLVMEPGTGGHMRTKVQLARAVTETPKTPNDWTFEDALVDETGNCRPSVCSPDQVCVKNGVCQAKIGGCTPSDCGTGKACVSVNNAASCADIVTDESAESYPNAIGDYVSLASGPNGLGIVVYDRIHGNLLGLVNTGSAWKSTILDGETGTRPNATDTGDDGIGASLFIDAKNAWHVTYVNGITETLDYLMATAGANPKIEMVDDGTGDKLGGPPFADGVHIVGDDSLVRVDDSGTVTIAYQDATAGTLRVATGTSQQTGHKWTIKAVAQPARFAGFFPRFVPQDTSVANWFRAIDPATKETSGDVAIVSP